MQGFFSFLFDFLIPSSCLACGRALHSFDFPLEFVPPPGWPAAAREFAAFNFEHQLCPGLAAPACVLCPECWLSLEPARGQGFLSRALISSGHVPLISPFFTNDPLLAMVRFLKFSGGRSAVPALAWWMANALKDYLESMRDLSSFDPLLVPVPLHPSRESSRGYNQAALLAMDVAERLGFEVDSRVLQRIKKTKSQSKLESAERVENVKGAFGIQRGDIANCRNIIVVDDLVTTGETVGACVAALNGASPASVAVLSAGRVME